jgi:hypothetical protein
MKNLSKLQQTFQDCVLRPGGAVTTEWVSANGRAAPEVQLSVYTHAYRSRLKEVLANDFPAMRVAIGDDLFEQLTDDYIEAHPSHYFSLRDFGRHIPDFVLGKIRMDECDQDMHWLYELALFEWTLGQAFDAADTTLITEQDMASISPDAWPDLTFRFHPSIQRLDLEWNVPEMWLAFTDDNPTQIAAACEEASPWLIWREQLITRFRSMNSDEQKALDILRAGGSFNDVCEVLAALMEEEAVPLHAAGLLKGWITQGLISEIY